MPQKMPKVHFIKEVEKDGVEKLEKVVRKSKRIGNERCLKNELSEGLKPILPGYLVSVLFPMLSGMITKLMVIGSQQGRVNNSPHKRALAVLRQNQQNLYDHIHDMSSEEQLYYAYMIHSLSMSLAGLEGSLEQLESSVQVHALAALLLTIGHSPDEDMCKWLFGDDIFSFVSPAFAAFAFENGVSIVQNPTIMLAFEEININFDDLLLKPKKDASHKEADKSLNEDHHALHLPSKVTTSLLEDENGVGMFTASPLSTLTMRGTSHSLSKKTSPKGESPTTLLRQLAFPSERVLERLDKRLEVRDSSKKFGLVETVQAGGLLSGHMRHFESSGSKKTTIDWNEGDDLVLVMQTKIHLEWNKLVELKTVLPQRESECRVPPPTPSNLWCWRRLLKSVPDVYCYINNRSQLALEELDTECQETVCHAIASVFRSNVAVLLIQMLHNNVSPSLFGAQDKHGNTPLHNAVISDDVMAVKELVALYPSALFTQNVELATPLDIAVMQKNKEVMNYLIQESVTRGTTPKSPSSSDLTEEETKNQNPANIALHDEESQTNSALHDEECQTNSCDPSTPTTTPEETENTSDNKEERVGGTDVEKRTYIYVEPLSDGESECKPSEICRQGSTIDLLHTTTDTNGNDSDDAIENLENKLPTETEMETEHCLDCDSEPLLSLKPATVEVTISPEQEPGNEKHPAEDTKPLAAEAAGEHLKFLAMIEENNRMKRQINDLHAENRGLQEKLNEYSSSDDEPQQDPQSQPTSLSSCECVNPTTPLLPDAFPDCTLATESSEREGIEKPLRYQLSFTDSVTSPNRSPSPKRHPVSFRMKKLRKRARSRIYQHRHSTTSGSDSRDHFKRHPLRPQETVSRALESPSYSDCDVSSEEHSTNSTAGDSPTGDTTFEEREHTYPLPPLRHRWTKFKLRRKRTGLPLNKHKKHKKQNKANFCTASGKFNIKNWLLSTIHKHGYSHLESVIDPQLFGVFGFSPLKSRKLTKKEKQIARVVLGVVRSKKKSVPLEVLDNLHSLHRLFNLRHHQNQHQVRHAFKRGKRRVTKGGASASPGKPSTLRPPTPLQEKEKQGVNDIEVDGSPVSTQTHSPSFDGSTKLCTSGANKPSSSTTHSSLCREEESSGVSVLEFSNSCNPLDVIHSHMKVYSKCCPRHDIRNIVTVGTTCPSSNPVQPTACPRPKEQTCSIGVDCTDEPGIELAPTPVEVVAVNYLSDTQVPTHTRENIHYVNELQHAGKKPESEHEPGCVSEPQPSDINASCSNQDSENIWSTAKETEFFIKEATGKPGPIVVNMLKTLMQGHDISACELEPDFHSEPTSLNSGETSDFSLPCTTGSNHTLSLQECTPTKESGEKIRKKPLTYQQPYTDSVTSSSDELSSHQKHLVSEARKQQRQHAKARIYKCRQSSTSGSDHKEHSKRRALRPQKNVQRRVKSNSFSDRESSTPSTEKHSPDSAVGDSLTGDTTVEDRLLLPLQKKLKLKSRHKCACSSAPESRENRGALPPTLLPQSSLAVVETSESHPSLPLSSKYQISQLHPSTQSLAQQTSKMSEATAVTATHRETSADTRQDNPETARSSIPSRPTTSLLHSHTVPQDHKERLRSTAELLHAQDYNRILILAYEGEPPDTLPPQLKIPYIFITGLAYYKLSNHKKSVQYFTQCLRLADECRRDGDITICNIYIGDIEFAKRRYPEAAGRYKVALHHYSRDSVAQDFRMVMPTRSAVWLKCGSAFKNASRVGDSVAAYEKAIELANSKKDQLSGHTSLGNLYQGIGENGRAVKEYEAAIELAKELDDNISLGWNHGNLGNALLGLHQRDKALHHLFKALDMAVDYETTPQAIGRAYNNLGTAFQSLNELSKAEEHYNLALAQAICGNDIPGQARVYGNIGNLQMLNKQYDRAVPHYTEVMHVSQDKATITTAHHNRGCAYYNWAEKKKTPARISYESPTRKESGLPNTTESPKPLERVPEFALPQSPPSEVSEQESENVGSIAEQMESIIEEATEKLRLELFAKLMSKYGQCGLCSPSPQPLTSWCWKRRMEHVSDVHHYLENASQAALEVLDTECQETVCHAIAISNFCVGLITLLLKKVTPRLFSVQDKHGNTPLHNAVMSGNVLNVKELVGLCQSALFTRNYEHATPLDIAVNYKNDEMVDYLMKQCVISDPHSISCVELLQSCLLKSMKNGYIHYLKILLQLHSEFGLAIDFECTDRDGFSAWHYLKQKPQALTISTLKMLHVSELNHPLLTKLTKILRVEYDSEISSTDINPYPEPNEKGEFSKQCYANQSEPCETTLPMEDQPFAVQQMPYTSDCESVDSFVTACSHTNLSSSTEFTSDEESKSTAAYGKCQQQYSASLSDKLSFPKKRSISKRMKKQRRRAKLRFMLCRNSATSDSDTREWCNRRYLQPQEAVTKSSSNHETSALSDEEHSTDNVAIDSLPGDTTIEGWKQTHPIQKLAKLKSRYKSVKQGDRVPRNECKCKTKTISLATFFTASGTFRRKSFKDRIVSVIHKGGYSHLQYEIHPRLFPVFGFSPLERILTRRERKIVREILAILQSKKLYISPEILFNLDILKKVVKDRKHLDAGIECSENSGRENKLSKSSATLPSISPPTMDPSQPVCDQEKLWLDDADTMKSFAGNSLTCSQESSIEPPITSQSVPPKPSIKDLHSDPTHSEFDFTRKLSAQSSSNRHYRDSESQQIMFERPAPESRQNRGVLPPTLLPQSSLAVVETSESHPSLPLSSKYQTSQLHPSTQSLAQQTSKMSEATAVTATHRETSADTRQENPETARKCKTSGATHKTKKVVPKARNIQRKLAEDRRRKYYQSTSDSDCSACNEPHLKRRKVAKKSKNDEEVSVTVSEYDHMWNNKNTRPSAHAIRKTNSQHSGSLGRDSTCSSDEKSDYPTVSAQKESGCKIESQQCVMSQFPAQPQKGVDEHCDSIIQPIFASLRCDHPKMSSSPTSPKTCINAFEHELSTRLCANKVRKVVVSVETEDDCMAQICHLQARWIDNYYFQLVPFPLRNQIEQDVLHHIPLSDCVGEYACVVGNPTIEPFEINGNNHRFPALPAATEEANYVSNCLKCEALIHEDATKEAVMKRLACARIVHIATHCVGRNLVFSTRDVLTAQDIEKLEYQNGPPALVVLNCCGTPDAMNEIALAFMKVNVHAVICINGRIEDEVAHKFAKYLYYYMISKKLSATQSFHRALLSIRNSSELFNPTNRYLFYGEDFFID